MGYALLMCNCIVCGAAMTVNPSKVPSIRVNGKREPVCRSCVLETNTVRKANGLPEVTIHPEAYEPCDEREL